MVLWELDFERENKYSEYFLHIFLDECYQHNYKTSTGSQSDFSEQLNTTTALWKQVYMMKLVLFVFYL